MNSGKSHLATSIAELLAGAVVHMDDCISTGHESVAYVERLDYLKLKQLLSTAGRGASVVFVDGICLREALARIEVVPALFVYVKRMGPNGLWHDGFHLEDYEADQNAVQNEPERSDLHYHSVVRPHERAEFVLHRVE